MKQGKWENLLPSEILTHIAQKVSDVIDLVRMGAVCRSWRATSLNHKWHPLLSPSPIPWFMGPHPGCKKPMVEYHAWQDVRQFYNSITEETFSISLPEARCCACYGIGEGWLMTKSCYGDLHLLHPLSRVQVQLPPLVFTSLMPEGFKYLVNNVVFTSPPIGKYRDCIVLVKFSRNAEHNHLAYAQPGDVAWNLLHMDPSIEYNDRYHDMLYQADKFYVITSNGKVVIFEAKHGCQEVRFKAVISTEFPFRSPYCTQAVYHYLVFVGSNLVVCGLYREKASSESHFKLGKLDSCTAFSEWTEVTDIGDGCLFFPYNLSLCLSPTPDLRCRKNSAFFSCDSFNQICGDHDTIALYSLHEDKIMNPWSSGGLFSHPIWLTFK